MLPVTENTASPPRALTRPTVLIAGVLLTAFTLAGLFTYKASAALLTLQNVQRTGTLAAKAAAPTDGLPAWAHPFAASWQYFGWVAIALTFGIVLGAAVKVLIPQQWLTRSLGRPGLSGVLLAAVAGAPLMLCSCCVAPLFEGVYARTRRLGSSLAMMFAAPSLNPFALLLTFLLFPVEIAAGRLVLAFALVLGGGAAAGWMVGSTDGFAAGCDVPAPTPPTARDALRGFVVALWDTTRKSLPAIALGVLVSAVVVQAAPPGVVGVGIAGDMLPIVILAALALVIALPTFGEIPIALALHAAGAPEGAVLAVLVAGPAINAPSLFTLARRTSLRVAVYAGLVVFAVAATGGIALELYAASS